MEHSNCATDGERFKQTYIQTAESQAHQGPVEEQALQQKLRMLESLGCSMEQVEDCPEILAMEWRTM
ncbi:hypothetical protein ScPMuIL_018997 [Solemya velum]